MSEPLNPYAATTDLDEFRREPLPDVGSILLQGVKLMGGNWVMLLGVLAIVWLPYELIVSYLEYEVYPDDLQVFAVTFFTNFLFTAIASVAVIRIAMQAAEGIRPSAGAALLHSMRILVPFGVTMVMWTIPVMLGALLLVIPGLILMTRMAVTDSVVVVERQWGFAAIGRSFDLTAGHFFPLFGMVLLFFALSVSPWVMLFVVQITFPQWDTWYVLGIFTFIMDVIEAYPVICWYLVYRRLS